MRFNILSLGLVATVFMSASISAIPVGDTLGGLGDDVGGTVSDAVDVGGTVSGDVDAADQATGGIVKRGRYHRNDEVVDGVEGRATGGAGGALAGGAENAAGDATDAVKDSAGGLRKRGHHHRRVGRGGRGGVVQDAVQNVGDTVDNVLGDLTTGGVRDTAGKRKRSVVGEADEEEADEEEPEEEVDENEEETDEEEADELGDAAPAVCTPNIHINK
ncbi:hypothetical protein HMPREF1544_00745 [Mucor circinelloides 1006PhL]|uniref:Uncharacterized protein n=1 Tax=Mucor circinelloides f. circinelloides (strain 1006PhL) TaxID=1220926 RepID=S2JVK2_MUCC1|nr:hypothetical protein HMPREF1544_00745 [Mucor circinelloides 1006PhL]